MCSEQSRLCIKRSVYVGRQKKWVRWGCQKVPFFFFRPLCSIFARSTFMCPALSFLLSFSHPIGLAFLSSRLCLPAAVSTIMFDSNSQYIGDDIFCVLFMQIKQTKKEAVHGLFFIYIRGVDVSMPWRKCDSIFYVCHVHSSEHGISSTRIWLN